MHSRIRIALRHLVCILPQGGGLRRHGDREVLAAIVIVATSGCTSDGTATLAGPCEGTADPGRSHPPAHASCPDRHVPRAVRPARGRTRALPSGLGRCGAGERRGLTRRGYNPGHRHRVLAAVLSRRNTVALTLTA